MVLFVNAIYNKITNYRGGIMKKIKCCSEGKFEIYVNGTPDIRGMPNDAFKALISSLEREIYKPREEEQKSDNARRYKE